MSMFHLGWFLGPGITIQGWNEPGFATGYDWTKPDIFVDAARAMERACFDVFILEDSSAVPYAYQGKMDFYLKHATMTPKFDPVMVTPYLIAATKHIGLAPTLTTTFYPPWLLARSLATLDHIPTAASPGTSSPPRPTRQRRTTASKSRSTTTCATTWPTSSSIASSQLWDAWEPDAVVMDEENHTFIDPKKVKVVEFRGQVLQDARAAQRAALAAGPAGVRRARRVAARPPVRRPQCRDRAGRRRKSSRT